jgi:hypothetical protein
MAPPKSDWDKQMHHLDAEIRRLEAEYNMYFAGRLPRPPFETKNRVLALVKKHDNSFIRNTADRFRFETLQTRYYKFMELVEKQMTARELGRPMIGRPSAAPKPAAAPPPAEPAHAAAAERARESAEKHTEKVVKFGRADAGADARVKELYDQLAAAKKQVGEAPVAYERVAALVKAQVTKFADDGTQVAFKIALKDGKVSLTVKPEKGE